ncbi:heme peroxidase family protein [soil metagenome]
MTNFGYKKMFEDLKSFKPRVRDLDKLNWFMTSNPNHYPQTLDALNPDFPKSVSRIPAGYTYLGQFISHDISFDSRSDRFIPVDRPWRRIDIESIVNGRNPVFDLETIYEKQDNGVIPINNLLARNSHTNLRLDYTSGDQNNSNLRLRQSYLSDLPRPESEAKAIIVDPRNDENLLVAQTQVAFMKFHNAVIKKLGGADNKQTFDKARKIVIRHYQHIILTDFLPRIVKDSILKDVIATVRDSEGIDYVFYDPSVNNGFIPLEFSTAALRTGHSMIRNGYNMNSSVKSEEAILRELALLTGLGNMRLSRTFLNSDYHLPSRWLINWKLFYDIDGSSQSQPDFNFAMKITGRYSSTLGILRPSAHSGRGNSLAALDLFRGRVLGLPNGQAVANEMAKKKEIQVLTTSQIESKLPEDLRQSFKDEAPLLFYILAEAEFQEKPEDVDKLGDVGSWIYAETIVRLLYNSPYSILQSDLAGDEDFRVEKDGRKTFGMAEMLKFIADANNTNDFDELNPIG